MNFVHTLLTLFLMLLTAHPQTPSDTRIVSVADFGLLPGQGQNATPYVIKALEACRHIKNPILFFPEGRYDFYPDSTWCRTLYISSHDHVAKRFIGLLAEGFDGLTVDGDNSDFIYHQYMLPMAFIDCQNTTVMRFSLDFETPNFTQAQVISGSPDSVVVAFDPSQRISVRDNRLYLTDSERTQQLHFLNEFVVDDQEGPPYGTGLAWNTADQRYTTAKALGGGQVLLRGMPKTPKTGNMLVMRDGYRPNPGIFSWRCSDMLFQDINIHWAQGMGCLSQRCNQVTMRRVNVKIREGSGRWFTTIDALHFAACKGTVTVEDGLYENMLDDAVNIHGDYLQITSMTPDRRTVTVAYKHHQSFGYEVADPKETIQFVAARTMLPLGKAVVVGSRRLDNYSVTLELDRAVPEHVKEGDSVENLEWTPRIVYRNNTIRNNRARGALFSSPRPTLIENNVFDHCSGSAILLSSDCNLWFLSGACHRLTIRGNTFRHCMTSFFQYGESVISIYPEIHYLEEQGDQYYHQNIRITDNTFIVSEPSVLYAKSVKKLVFKRNDITVDPLYAPLLKEGTPLLNTVHCQKVTPATL